MEPIRVVHHLAATGGTIITRCLAAMNQVAVLSELHPDRWNRGRYDPFVQARFGYSDWVTKADLDAAFLAEINVLYAGALRGGRHLIIRDWSHTDFLDHETHYSRTVEALSGRYPLIRVATVRHPIDNWIAMSKSKFVHMPHAEYLQRYASFLDMVASLPIMRYEDFCSDPNRELKRICMNLQIGFAMDYRSRIPHVNWITGASGRQSDILEGRIREPIAQRDLEALMSDPLLHIICSRLGYEVA